MCHLRLRMRDVLTIVNFLNLSIALKLSFYPGWVALHTQCIEQLGRWHQLMEKGGITKVDFPLASPFVSQVLWSSKKYTRSPARTLQLTRETTTTALLKPCRCLSPSAGSLMSLLYTSVKFVWKQLMMLPMK